MEFKVKSNKNGYFVDWVGEKPCFNPNMIFGKRLSETEAEDLIRLLVEKYPGEKFDACNVK